MSSEYVPGLEGIIAARTEISLVDGANGRLVEVQSRASAHHCVPVDPRLG